MGTTIEDIQYEEHLENLHKSYIYSLEKFAKSKNLEELKENLEDLQGARVGAEDWTVNVKGEELDILEKQLAEISTINDVYKVLVDERGKSDRRFKIGTILAVVGLLFATIGLLLSSAFIFL